VIQLDNINKGKKMELSPEQQALDERLRDQPVVKEIHEDLEGLKVGQKLLDEKVDKGFIKGTKRMDGIEGKVEHLSDKFDSFVSMFTNHVQRTEQMHREIKEDIKDDKYQDLKEEKKALQQEIAEGKKRKWDILKGIGLVIAGAIVSAISVKVLG
jgi:hypothetical protein